MGALYWGAGYRPIHRNVYVTYRTSIRAGRVYYGVHRQYGTRGSLTQKRYGRSTFYKRRKAAERKAKRAARRSRARSRGRRGK